MVSWRGHCWVGLWFEWRRNPSRRNPSRELCQTRCLPPSALLAHFFDSLRASLVAQMVKNLPAVQETCVRFLGWEDALEKGMATHSSIPAWRIPWTEEPGGLQSMGS